MFSQVELAKFYDDYISALQVQRRNEVELVDAQHSLEDEKQTIIVNSMIDGGNSLGKNAEQREANIAKQLTNEVASVRMFEDNVTVARTVTELSRIRIEKALALMRATEIDLKVFDRDEIIRGRTVDLMARV